VLVDLKKTLLFIAEPDMNNTASGRLLLGIRVSLSRHFLERLGENVSMGMARKAAEGH